MKHALASLGPSCELDECGMTHMHLPGLLSGAPGGTCLWFCRGGFTTVTKLPGKQK